MDKKKSFHCKIAAGSSTKLNLSHNANFHLAGVTIAPTCPLETLDANTTILLKGKLGSGEEVSLCFLSRQIPQTSCELIFSKDLKELSLVTSRTDKESEVKIEVDVFAVISSETVLEKTSKKKIEVIDENDENKEVLDVKNGSSSSSSSTLSQDEDASGSSGSSSTSSEDDSDEESNSSESSEEEKKKSKKQKKKIDDKKKKKFDSPKNKMSGKRDFDRNSKGFSKGDKSFSRGNKSFAQKKNTGGQKGRNMDCFSCGYAAKNYDDLMSHKKAQHKHN